MATTTRDTRATGSQNEAASSDTWPISFRGYLHCDSLSLSTHRSPENRNARLRNDHINRIRNRKRPAWKLRPLKMYLLAYRT